MVNRDLLQSHWDEIKGRLKQQWAGLSEEELQSVNGNVEALVGLIEQKSGEARMRVEQYLDELSREVSSNIEGARGRAREYAHEAGEAFHEAPERLRQGYQSAEEMIRRRPAESAAVAFGAGLVAGVVVGLLIRSR